MISYRTLRRRLAPLRAGWRSVRDPIGAIDAADTEAMQVVMATVLGPRSHSVDVGANGGEMVAAMRRLAPLGQVIAFEPLPHLAQQIEQRFPEVDVRRVATLTFSEGRQKPSEPTSPW